MAFTSISSTVREVGKSITKSLIDLISTNLDDLNSRVASVEGSANKIVIYSEVVINAASASTITGLDVFRVQASYDLTDAKVAIFEKGSLTGNLEIDIKKSSSSDFTSAVSVFTTKPKIDYSTASSYDESNNTIFDNTNKTVSEGDYLKIDVSELPANGNISSFVIYLIGESL